MLRIFSVLWFTLMIYTPFYVQAQTYWFQQDDFPGTARSGAVSAVIGSKGYYGTGMDESANKLNDWWSFDVATGEWTQLADFPGAARNNALSFAIEGKVYVLTGQSDTDYLSDMYVYDPSLDNWTPLNDFSGGARTLAVASVLNGVAYVGTGRDADGQLKDWWAYDSQTDSWSQKADLTSYQRQSAISFALAGQVFVGSGQYFDGGTFLTNNLFAYDPETDSWTEKSFAQSNLTSLNATAFVLGDTAYVFGGSTGTDIWKYDPVSNDWTKGEKLDINGENNRTGSSAMAFGDVAYIIGGNYFDLGSFSDTKKKEVWKYYVEPLSAPSQPGYVRPSVTFNEIELHWTDESDNETAYVVRLWDQDLSSIVFQDTLPAQSTNYKISNVEQHNNYEVRIWAYNEVGRSDYRYHYITTPKYLKEPRFFAAKGVPGGIAELFWKDESQREDGYILEMSVGDTLNFNVIDTVAASTTRYIYSGMTNEMTYYFRISAYIADTLQSGYAWEYPGVNLGEWGAWEKVASTDVQVISGLSTQFAIGDKLYYANTFNSDASNRYLIEYDIATGTWSEKATPMQQYETNIFSIGESVYFVSGKNDSGKTNSVFKYDQSTDTWNQLGDFPGISRMRAAAFNIGNKGYIIGGDTVANTSGDVQTNSVWEYNSTTDSWTQKNDFPGGNRTDLLSFSTTDAAYVGMGNAYNGGERDKIWVYYDYFHDFYKYDPVNDTWQRVSDYPGSLSSYAHSFAGNGTNGIIVGGKIQQWNTKNNWWIYQPDIDQWTIFADILNSVNDTFYPFEVNGEFYLMSPNDVTWETEVFRYNDQALGSIRDLKADKILPDSTVFKWSFEDENTTGLYFQRNGENGFVNLDTLSTGTFEYTLYDLQPVSLFDYRLIQFNDNVTSGGSNVVELFVPGEPYLQNISKVGSDSAKINYSPRSGEASVLMETSTNFGEWIKTDTLPAGTQEYLEYFFAVEPTAEHVAVRLTTMLESSYNMVSDTLALEQFLVPVNIQASWNQADEIEVSWENQTAFDEGYHVNLTDSLNLGLQYTESLSQGTYNAFIDPDINGLESSEIFQVSLQGDFGGSEKWYDERIATLYRILAPQEADYTVQPNDKVTLNWQDKSRIETAYYVLHVLDESQNQYDTLAVVGPDTETALIDFSDLPETIEIKLVTYNSDLNMSAASESIFVTNRITSIFVKSKEVVLYPNPASEYIEIRNAGENEWVTIRNQESAILFHKKVSEWEKIGVQTWPSGIYFVEVGVEVIKLIIN